MNERFRLLADQAGLRFTQLMSNPMVPVVDGKETDLEKFAQLIVRECMTNLYLNGYDDSVLQIQKHFGISESPPRLGTVLTTKPLTQPPGVLPNTSEGIEPNRNQFGYPFSVDSRNKK